MLHVHLVPRVGVRGLGLLGVGVQTQISWDQASLASITTGFGINDAVATLCGLDEFGILLLEDGEVSLGFPIPDGVGGKDEIHFFQSTLVGLRVERPYDDDGGSIDSTEEVERLFVKFLEDGG